MGLGHNVNLVFNPALNVVQVLADLIVVNVVNIVQGPKVSKIGSLDKNFRSRRLWRRIEPPQNTQLTTKKSVYGLLKDGGRFWERRDQPNWSNIGQIRVFERSGGPQTA